MSSKLEEAIFPEILASGYEIIDVTEGEKEITVEIKPKKHSCKCPECGEESNFVHITFERKIQDLPLNNKTVYLKAHINLYVCLNPECATHTFADDLGFVRPFGTRTYRLDQMILAVAMFMSNEGASRVLKELGVVISADSIKNIYDRLDFADDSEVEEIGIDDVALRKGHNYGTVIYDMKDRHLIALFEGRTAKETKECLKNFPKIKRVARDRASSYASAIDELFPDCLQVADTFHLLQNLIDKIEEILKNDLPDQFFLKDGCLLDKKPKKTRVFVEPSQERKDELDKVKYDNSPPLDDEGNSVQYDNKNHGDGSTEEEERKQRRLEKQEKIRQIRAYCSSPDSAEKSRKEIAQMFDTTVPTLKKYRNLSEEEISALEKPKNSKKRESPMNDYLNIIYKMIRDDYSLIDISYYVSKLPGFSCSMNSLNKYIYLITKNNFPDKRFSPRIFYKKTYPEDVTVIKRRDVINYIVQGNAGSEYFESYFDLIAAKYPQVGILKSAYQEFHKVIMGDEVERVHRFLQTYKKDQYLSSFVASLKSNIAAVEAAISTNVNSGFVEGLNCKFKLRKRILFGRSKVVNLEKKCKLAFLPYDEDKGYQLENLLRKCA